MRKIPCLFERDFTDKRNPVLLQTVTPGCEWVLKGEGIATRKWDGSCVLIKGGTLYVRYDAKHGKKPPEDFIPAQPDPDPVTGHWPGWVLPNGKQYQWHREAFTNSLGFLLREGTYEACGPKLQGNPERLDRHELRGHRNGELHLVVPRNWLGLRAYLAERDIEGLVFHRDNGDMAKIRLADYGMARVPR